MSTKKNSITVGKVLTYMLLLLLAVGVIGFFALFTNGFTDNFKSFYVEQNGQKILKSKSEMSFKYSEELRFDVKYTFGFMTKDAPKGYSVKIVPNITDETNFDFFVDSEPYFFKAEKDLTTAFDIKQNDDYFTITIPTNYGMQQVLESVYSGKKVVLPDSAKLNHCFYTMLITSYNEQQTYSISFNFYRVGSVELDKGGVVF